MHKFNLINQDLRKAPLFKGGWGDRNQNYTVRSSISTPVFIFLPVSTTHNPEIPRNSTKMEVPRASIPVNTVLNTIATTYFWNLRILISKLSPDVVYSDILISEKH